MKTTFETPEELEFLNKLLLYCTIKTEDFVLCSVNKAKELPDYTLMMINFRRKIFEYRETEDPNKDLVDELEYKLVKSLQYKSECLKIF